MDLHIARVTPDKLSECWPLCAPLLDRAVAESRGRYDLEALRVQIFAGNQHLWIILKENDELAAAFTTEFANYPCRLMLSVVFCGSDDSLGGSAELWGYAMGQLKEWARLAGCSGVEAVGRRGWARLMAPQGFEEVYITIESEV